MASMPHSLRNCTLLLIALLVAGSAGCRAADWPLWQSYRSHFLDQQGRIIDHQGNERTTSEGQSYAMFFALVANDRSTFDRLLSWTSSNMAQGDLTQHLPAWLWGRHPDGTWSILDPNPASDADAWIAYDLIEAGRLWNTPRYSKIGFAMLSQIARREVIYLPGFGPMLAPGVAGFQHPTGYTVNASYLPLFVFERLAAVDPSGPWQHIALGIPRLVRQTSVHGFVMDWSEFTPGQGFHPGVAHPENAAEKPLGSYDAIRVYLWAGMIDSHNPQRPAMLNALAGMSNYLADHDAPPEKVSDQGVPIAQDGPVGFSAAVLPLLRALPYMEKAAGRQTVRLHRLMDAGSGLYGPGQTYYDQNLSLFATGFIEGRFRFGPGGELKVEWTHG